MAQTLEKRSTETKTFDMDFSSLLRSNDSISTVDSVISTSCSFVTGSSNVTVSNIVFDGNIVQFQISGGTNEEHYNIETTIATNNTDILVGEGTLRVKD